MKLLGLYYDPYIGAENRFIHEKYNWAAPGAGIYDACTQLNSLLPDGMKYSLTLRSIDIPAVSTHAFGASDIDLIDSAPPQFYAIDEWMQLWDTLGFNPSAWPKGGQIHVKDFIERNNIVQLINQGDIDELWTGGLPLPEAFEGAMLAPAGDTLAYGTHDRVVYIPGLQRRCVWHMFQISNWNPLHNYWHRIEAIMAHIWGTYGYGYEEQWSPQQDMNNVRHYWQLFSLTDNTRNGEAQLGTCHFMPNSKGGYLYRMADVVPSGAFLWKNWPDGFPLDLSRTDRFELVSAETWKDYADYMWQFSHIPGAVGTHVANQFNPNFMVDGRYANWWKYIINVNDMTGKDAPWTKPWTGTQDYATYAVRRYNDRALVRWEAREADPEDATYTVNGKAFQRQGAWHTKFSTDVALAVAYTIRLHVAGVTIWTITYDQNVPLPDVGDVGTMLSEQEVRGIIDAAHTTSELINCPKPDTISLGTGVWNLYWANIEGGTTSGINMNLNANLFRLAYENIAKAICAKVPTPDPVPDPTPMDLVADYNAIHLAMRNAGENGIQDAKLVALDTDARNKLLNQL